MVPKNGSENQNWRHGGHSDYLSEDDQKWIESKHKEYVEFYPHLKEPAMVDMLENYLKLLLQVERMWRHILDPAYPPDRVAAGLKRIQLLIRSCSLIGARMGVTYTSQRRMVQKEDKAVKLPEELIEEFTKGT